MGLITNPFLHPGQILPGLAKVDDRGEKLGTRLPGERHPTGAVPLLRTPPTTRGQRGRRVLRLSAGRDLIPTHGNPFPASACAQMWGKQPETQRFPQSICEGGNVRYIFISFYFRIHTEKDTITSAGIRESSPAEPLV